MSELGRTAGGRGAYGLGIAVAGLASFLILWTTIVRDDGQGIGFFALIMAAAVGGSAAWFRPAGMARTMFGVAIMQALVGIAIATAPSTARMPGGSLKILLFSGVFMALWLMSAAFFHAAAKAGPKARAVGPGLKPHAYVLAVHDLAASTAYFVGVLGFAKEWNDADRWQGLARGEVRLMLGRCPDALPATELGDHNYFGFFATDDVDALHAQFSSRGATILSAPDDKPWGWREMAVGSPEGHRMMFAQSIE